jgi:hypothetical protein
LREKTFLSIKVYTYFTSLVKGKRALLPCLQALAFVSSNCFLAYWMTPTAEHRETMRLVPAGAEVIRDRKVFFGSLNNFTLRGLPYYFTLGTNSIIFLPHAAVAPRFIIRRISHRLIISGVSDSTSRGIRRGEL